MFHLEHSGHARNEKGGHSKFGDKLRVLKATNASFNNLSHIVIVTDADDDPSERFRRVVEQIGAIGLNTPNDPYQRSAGRPSISIAIIPPQGEGSLESYCIEAARRTGGSIPAAVDTFSASVRAERWRETLRGKLWLRAFIAAKHQRDPCINLGPAFSEGDIIPVLDKSFDELADFLKGFG